MNLGDRIALHAKMAEGYHAAYADQHQEDAADLSPAWTFAEDAVYFSLYFTGGKPVPIGELSNANGMSMTDGAALEAKIYSATLPDWGPAEFRCWPAESGFVTRTRFEGHTLDGTLLSFHMVDFVETNPSGQISYWETFCDGEEFGRVAEAALGVRGPFPDAYTYWGVLHQRAAELGLV